MLRWLAIVGMATTGFFPQVAPNSPGVRSAAPEPPPLRLADAATTTTTASTTASTTATARRPLPERMAATGDGTQLITAVTKGRKNAYRDGVLTWWERRGDHWAKVGSTAARFGVNGLSDARVEGDGTTPTGLFRLPLAFGSAKNPGTEMPWHQVDSGSWWDENAASSRYNTWFEHCPRTVCWTARTRPARASEHLADYSPEYDYAVFIGYNAAKRATRRVRPPEVLSGSGIFLHVFGPGHTAGCISVKRSALKAIVRWLDPAAGPHIAIGTTRTIYGY